jgi:hypothetical protein
MDRRVDGRLKEMLARAAATRADGRADGGPDLGGVGSHDGSAGDQNWPILAHKEEVFTVSDLVLAMRLSRATVKRRLGQVGSIRASACMQERPISPIGETAGP